MRRLLLLAALLFLAAPSAAQAKPFAVGTGQNGGIAIDDARHGLRRLAGQRLRARRRRPVLRRRRRARRAARSQATIAFPGQGYNRSRVSRAAAGAERRRRDRPAHDRQRCLLLPRALDRRRPHVRPAVQISGEQFAEAVQGPGGRDRARRRPDHDCAPACSPPTARARPPSGSQLGPYLEGVFTDIAAIGRGGARRRLRRGHDPRLPAPRRRRSQQRRAAWQQIDPAPGRAARGRGPARRLRGHARADRDARQRLFVQRLEGAGWSPPVAHLRRRQQQRLRARRQRPRPPDRGDHLLRLPTSSTRPRPTAACCGPRSCNVGNFEEYPTALEIATNAAGAGAAVMNEALRRQGRQRHALHAAHRAGQAPPHPRRARAGAQHLRRRQALARRRGRPRHPPRRAGRRCCAAPASAAPAAPAAASAPASALATSCAAARARIPVRRHPAPRQGAHAAPARPPLRATR